MYINNRLLCFHVRKALAAINRTVFPRLKGNLAGCAAVGANSVVHFAGTASGGFSCATASFAALGLIDKSLFSIELLFTGCKDEFVPTILAD